jgi:hypothetical protein
MLLVRMTSQEKMVHQGGEQVVQAMNDQPYGCDSVDTQVRRSLLVISPALLHIISSAGYSCSPGRS